MRIANPIYDVVFKYLMEDTEIARQLLSKIIEQEIVELTLEPQEFIGRSDKFEIIILRLDFKAIIKTAEGTHKKILIELQKGKNPADILRFRKYLGDNYRKEYTFIKNTIPVTESLPIITIYFLGFPLKSIDTTVLKVNRTYIDLITNKSIDSKEEFIEKLTHDSYIIQISRLDEKERTELERLLRVFNQSYITDDKKILEIIDADLENNELLQQMIERLRRAATKEDILNRIEIEEQVENTIEQHIREKQLLAEANYTLANQRQELANENAELSSKKRELANENSVLKKKLEELERRLKNNK